MAQQTVPVTGNWPSSLLPHIKREPSLPITAFENLGPLSASSGITAVKFALQAPSRNHEYSGSLFPERIENELAAFLTQNSNGKSPEVKRALSEFIGTSAAHYLASKKLQEGYEPKTPGPLGVFLSLRLGEANKFYTLNWHADRDVYVSKTKNVNSLYLITMLGNPTRILPESQTVRKLRMSEHIQAGKPIKKGIFLDFDKEPLVPIQMEDVIRFTFGQPDSSRTKTVSCYWPYMELPTRSRRDSKDQHTEINRQSRPIEHLFPFHAQN